MGTISLGQERKAQYLLIKPGINPYLGFLINIPGYFPEIQDVLLCSAG